MATVSRAPSRPPHPTRARPPAHEHRAARRAAEPTPFVLSAGSPAPVHRARPIPRRRTWLAVLGAAFSLLLVGVMSGAAIVCAEGACRGQSDPVPARAVLDLDHRTADPVAPVTPGRPPTAEPAR